MIHFTSSSCEQMATAQMASLFIHTGREINIDHNAAMASNPSSQKTKRFDEL